MGAAAVRTPQLNPKSAATRKDSVIPVTTSDWPKGAPSQRRKEVANCQPNKLPPKNRATVASAGFPNDRRGVEVYSAVGGVMRNVLARAVAHCTIAIVL
jgi:hypothetical protein